MIFCEYKTRFGNFLFKKCFNIISMCGEISFLVSTFTFFLTLPIVLFCIYLVLFCYKTELVCCRLEKESGFFFNMKYFEETIQAGEWDEIEKYLTGFTKVDDNRYSMKIFFEIRKQKYLEALDR